MFGLRNFLGLSGADNVSASPEPVHASDSEAASAKDNTCAATPETKQKAVELLTRIGTKDGSIDSHYSMPIIIISLTSEMINILKQRLTAQNIDTDKAAKVLDDVLAAGFSLAFIHELFKPQEMYSRVEIRKIFDRLAHASIMRLNATSCV